MATIHAFLAVHSGKCDTRERHWVCSDGTDVRGVCVTASFYPLSGMSMRERIQLARMAALFATREGRARVCWSGESDG